MHRNNRRVNSTERSDRHIEETLGDCIRARCRIDDAPEFARRSAEFWPVRLIRSLCDAHSESLNLVLDLSVGLLVQVCT